jgi:hypothetical protein
MKFGIPVKELPLTEEGGVKNARHLKWLNDRSAKEQAGR